MSITSWEGLYEALRALDPTRSGGFEGFISKLFEAATGDRYFVAATGDQPSGDAHDERGGVAIQAKAYFRTKRFKKDEAIHQLLRAIRSLPELDVYVLAATQDTAQLRDELAWAEDQFGVDVLLLHLAPELTELGAIAVTHWDVAQDFLPNVDTASQLWASEQRVKIHVQQQIENLRKRLLGVATQIAFQRRCNALLRRRFFRSETPQETFNPIELSESVSRSITQNQLRKWWDVSLPENAVLIGDEGMGKSWLAAEFSNQLAEYAGSIVLWLDSSAWCAATSVADVIDRALKAILLPSERQFQSYRRKICHRWPGPLLVVLDGANELDAWRAAGAILKVYFVHHAEFSGRIRLLFTSRHTSAQPTVSRDIWHNSMPLKVEPFSPEELDEALATFAPEVNASNIEPDTYEFIRVPLYFRMFLRYRTRLASVHHLDKRFLLWMEVEEKLADQLARDPGMTAIRKATEADLSVVLAELAQSLSWPAEGEPTVPMAEVRHCIPGFQNIRADLQAKKIIIGNDLDFARWSLDHAIVAMALLLQREAQRHANEPLDTLHDRLRAHLEPLPSTDDKVRAIHVAVLLSFIHSPQRFTLSMRAALLTMWLPQRNANLREDELSFFVEADLAAYIAAVEWSFRKLLPGDFETTLIAPIARRWADRGAAFISLDDVLQRWLRLVFPGDKTGSKNRDTPPDPKFHVAESEPQLRLSSVAISVLSFRPEISLLPALVDCYRSHSFCYQDWGDGKEQHRFSVKTAYDHLGILLRWHFDENTLVAALSNMASQVSADGDDWQDIHYFSRNIRLAVLPPLLGEAKDVYDRSGTEEKTSVDYLRAVLAGQTGRDLNCLSFDDFGRDAIRRDLPALTAEEIERLPQFAQDFFRTHQREVSFHNVFEQQVFAHLLPWLARYSAPVYHTLVADYAILGCTAQNPAQVFTDVEGVPPVGSRGSEIIATIFARMPGLLGLKHVSGFIIAMTEIVLLHGTVKEITEWSEWLNTAKLPEGASYVNLLPLPTAFASYAPPAFFEVAKERAAAAVASLREHPDDKIVAHTAKHWLYLASYCAAHDRTSAEWAFTILSLVPSNSELEWPLVYLLMKISDHEVLQRVLATERVRRFLDGEDGSFLALQLIANPAAEKLASAVIDALPLSAAGLLYWRRNDEVGLRRWVQRLANASFIFLHTEPPLIRIGHRSYRTADDVGLITGSSVETPRGGERRSHYRGSSAWGVDRETETSAATQEELDRLISEFRNDHDQLRDWAGRELSGFNGGPALDRWAEVAPLEFLDFAKPFFHGLEAAGIKTFYAMGTLAWCIAAAMVKIDPRGALEIAERWCQDWAFRVVTFGGLSNLVTSRLWSRACNSAPGITELRRELCDSALNDEELLAHVLAATGGDTVEEIVAIAKDRLGSERARERALGVTLLGFTGTDEPRILLEPIRAVDPSYWVRDQSSWSERVNAVELCCRNQYARLLDESLSLEALAAGLAELRPALSPLARAWRLKIEKSFGRRCGTDRASTYIDLFWYHWEGRNSSHQNVELMGRKLKEFCRGEKLKDGVTSRMKPWWN